MQRPFFVVTAAVISILLQLFITSFVFAADVDQESQGAIDPATRPEVYGQGVRDTPWLTPADERAGFHLPDNFEVRLFASEPQIAKPLNMAFDNQNRMWVTQSVEYPYPAKPGSVPRDAVMVLEDANGDGSADSVVTFADQLNVPIGVLPFGDGCLCFSIPNLWYLRDTDGDGRCDQREVVLGPFDTTRDTHGMINSLRDGGDGWIYACHGFNNQSQVAGRDGHAVTMHSGNTFRFRPDGSRIDQVTSGQVNPFGMTEDDWGYRYSADCHSKPITQLVFGACYPSFGRPHDGLGFLPPMVEHLHGSTAICGVLYYPNYSPIVPLREQMLSGNVMTSRLNRNRVVYEGATAKGIELPDFMTSDDPWFRPVDLRLGPDGHLYVADFYNKIIGHYEVPLDHPERDRTSGRIWQIRYRPADGSDASANNSLAEPVAELFDQQAAPHRRVQALHRAFDDNAIDAATLSKLMADSSDHVRVAALRLAAEFVGRDRDGSKSLIDGARRGLSDPVAHAAQASAELLGRHGNGKDITPLLICLSVVPESDPVQRQTLRIAVRNLLERASSDDEIWSVDDDEQLASILLGVKRPETSGTLLAFLSSHPSAADRDALLAHAASQSATESIDDCVRVARAITADNAAKQWEVVNVLIESQNARPGRVPAALRTWALELAQAKLEAVAGGDHVLGWASDDVGAWSPEPRPLRSGQTALLTSSLGRGESYTGRRYSDPFPAPHRISFWVAGHNGFPDQPDHGKNRVRLVRVADGHVLRETTPPRNDTARRIQWDTAELQGEMVRLECIDGDTASAYAWLAVGRFEPAWIDASDRAESLIDGLSMIRRLGLAEMEAELVERLDEGRLAQSLRLHVAQTIAALRGRQVEELVLRFGLQAGAPPDLIDSLIAAALSDDRQAILAPIQLLCKRLSLNEQSQLATAWIKAGADIELLISLLQRGWLSPIVLAGGDAAQAIEPRLSDEQRAVVRSLTANLNIDAAQSQLLQNLQQTVSLESADFARGQELYTKHCANCHQLRGQGFVVGPQLDGAATRSIERLLEDVITPDRNVDLAFRTTSFLLDDGQVISGLVTSESPDQIVLVEPTGKPISIDVANIEQRRDAGRSLMPGNMGEVLTVEQLGDLIRFVKGGK